MKITPEILLADLEEVIEMVPSDQQIIIALRYGSGPQELRDTIAGIRDKLEAIKAKVKAQ